MVYEVFDMVGLWQYNLNKKIADKGENVVTLDSILTNIRLKNRRFKLNLEYSTIRYINEEEYTKDVYSYVEPEFHESQCKTEFSPRFILFSAPGATGKSALAKHICYTKNGIYWDLPENKIAEYSFQGAISKAVGFSEMSNFIKSIEDGNTFLVIDAFDEAEAGSGRSGIEFFLRDLNAVTEKCENICAVLMARTESALFIKEYFEKNNVKYKHYEVGYFPEYNSKTYIENRLRKGKIEISPVVKACIDEQFREIHRIFPDKNAKEFLGYAPVLDALAASYSEERNTANLLKNTASGEKNCQLMVKILDHLLERERDKFVKALNNKFSELKISINFDNVYKKEEQINRIIGKLLFDDVTIFGYIYEAVPTEYCDEYLEVVNTQLPQHPFIFSKEENGNIYYEFTGPAFRDYAIAFGLANEELHDFVREFLADNRKYCPSQMLIEFYELFSNKSIVGKDIPLMYNSFKAHARLGESASLNISGTEGECYVEFILNGERENGEKEITLLSEFLLTDFSEGIYINQVSDCYIDISGKVYVGNSNGEARINNSIIMCDEIIWGSEHVLIEAYSPGICNIFVNTFNTFSNATCRFEVKFDKKDNLKISANNIGSYYKLLAYKADNSFDSETNDFESFANVVRRIFSCLRSHSKDTPARKMDFIDNRVIGFSDKKKNILNFLLEKGILYNDEQDWLYKLDTDKLSQFSIIWNNVRNGELSSLKKLYSEYTE